MLPEKLFNMDVVVKGEFSPRGYPLFFSSYRLNRASIGNVECVVVEPKAEVRPLQIDKVCARIEKKEGVFCVFFAPKLTAYQRKSLSGRGVAWMASEDTFHIPFLGASCMPRRRGELAPKKLSAGAQALAVRIVDGGLGAMTTTQIAEAMGKSLSSISAYFAEIASVAPEAIGSRGRTRFVAPPGSAEARNGLFAKLEPFLSTPVKRRFFLVLDDGSKHEFENLPVSGVTALSRVTMLADDPWETRAVAASERDVIARMLEDCEVVAEGDSPDALLEVWKYEPSERDRVSLYLDVRALAESEGDDRLADAADELRRRFLE